MQLPKPLRLASQDKLTFRQNGGPGRFFALPFLGAGIFAFLLGFGIVPNKGGQPFHLAEYIAVFFMGITVTSGAAAAIFGRKLTIIDRAQRLLVEEWGLSIIPMKRKETRISNLKEISLEYDYRLKPRGQFPVILVSARRTTLDSPKKYEVARAMAASIAEFLNLPLVDRTTQKTLSFPPNTSRSNNKEASPTNQNYESLKPPTELNCQITETKDGTEIFVPNLSGSGIAIAILLTPIIFFLINIFSQRNLQDIKSAISAANPIKAIAPYAIFFVLFFLIPLFLIARVLINKNNYGTLLKIKPGLITVIGRTSANKRAQSIPSADVLSIERHVYQDDEELPHDDGMESPGITPFQPNYESRRKFAQKASTQLSKMNQAGNHIVLKTKEDILSIGSGLPEDELDYLCNLIEKKLKST